jgi:hypothetical protein
MGVPLLGSASTASERPFFTSKSPSHVLLLQAAKGISTLLKPLEILTRPLPGHLRQGMDDPEMTPELESMFRDIRAQTSDPGRAPGSLPTPGELVQRHLAEVSAEFPP